MNKNQTLLDINAAIAAILDSKWSYFSAASYMKEFFAEGIIWCLLYDDFLWPHIHMLVCNAYSYFEKGCRKKCTRQSWQALWVVLSSPFLREIWKNWHERAMKMCLRVLTERNKVGSTATVVRNSVSIISHITLRDCRVHIFSDNFSRNSCIHRLFSCAYICAFVRK